jgi:hypothetical protein
MLTLDRLQHTIGNAVLGKPNGSVAPLFEPGLSDPIRRLRIYQNNTRASLTSTLLVVFPVTAQLVDERFFRYAANEFICFHPPTEPRLVRYGAAFPNFLRTFPGLAEVPFVAETARLEWAIAEALDSASLPPLPIGTLNGVEEATPDIVLQPSLRFVISHWPVLSIWSAHQEGSTIEGLDMSAHRPERVALWRSGDTVRFSLLTGAQFSFRSSLKAGLGLDKAVSRAITHEPMFDFVGALVSLFNDRLVTEVCPHANRPTAGDSSDVHDS